MSGVSFSGTDSGFCIYHLFEWSNFNFLHNSQWITLPTQRCLVIYSFCANLLHSLIMWLIVSFLPPHNLQLLFCCGLSILALIWLVLMALFCAAIRRDSVSLLRFSIIIIITYILLYLIFHDIVCFIIPYISLYRIFYDFTCICHSSSHKHVGS